MIIFTIIGIFASLWLLWLIGNFALAVIYYWWKGEVYEELPYWMRHRI